MLVSIHPNSIPGTVWGRIRVQPPPGWEPCVSPGPAPRPLPNSESRLESRLARLWKLPRRSSEVSSFCPLASLCSSCATVWGNVPKGNPASCLFATPLLPVSFRNSWFLCPQILGFCQDPEWRNVLWVGAVGVRCPLRGPPAPVSHPQQLSVAFKQMISTVKVTFRFAGQKYWSAASYSVSLATTDILFIVIVIKLWRKTSLHGALC